MPVLPPLYQPPRAPSSSRNPYYNKELHNFDQNNFNNNNNNIHGSDMSVKDWGSHRVHDTRYGHYNKPLNDLHIYEGYKLAEESEYSALNGNKGGEVPPQRFGKRMDVWRQI
ncbi:hypothetical protein ADEAN_000790800 [Angomonas deanei]|uniref:Uncharacterized protein n=1 Tax=Angomonas deanei TaxID=59799 RepID=A0A7G2CKI9_9TRYP|nr:hypothetical protein ADEAN_000790800 [Angomonas deanei]